MKTLSLSISLASLKQVAWITWHKQLCNWKEEPENILQYQISFKYYNSYSRTNHLPRLESKELHALFSSLCFSRSPSLKLRALLMPLKRGCWRNEKPAAQNPQSVQGHFVHTGLYESQTQYIQYSKCFTIVIISNLQRKIQLHIYSYIYISTYIYLYSV